MEIDCRKKKNVNHVVHTIVLLNIVGKRSLNRETTTGKCAMLEQISKQQIILYSKVAKSSFFVDQKYLSAAMFPGTPTSVQRTRIDPNNLSHTWPVVVIGYVSGYAVVK